MKLADIRREYAQRELDPADCAPDAISQLEGWLAEALEAQVAEPTAMTLATVGPEGRPSARVVLLKGVEAGALLFYTNYQSRKGREIAAHPFVAATFFWPELERQVRVNGAVQRVSRTESDAYFQSRPLPSRIGAWTSSQSSVLPSRETLEQELAANETRFADGIVPLPEHWGGFRVVPEEIEFWQGRRSRLHDRIQFRKEAGRWVKRRLSP